MNLDYLRELKIKDMCKTIAASLKKDKEIIEDVCEPFLLQEILFKKTQSRQAARKVYQHLNINVPQRLF